MNIMFLCLTILALMTGNWLVSKYKNSYFAPPRSVEQKEYCIEIRGLIIHFFCFILFSLGPKYEF